MYLVTGAAGFIGRWIASELLLRGERVRGIDNFSTGKRENLAGLDGLDLVEGDINDVNTIAAVCEGIQCIFHEAAIPSVPRSVADPIGSNHANVTGTLRVLEAARAAGVRRIIFAGSSSAYGNTPTLPKRENMPLAPISPYAVSKAAGELYMQSYFRVFGLETVVLRYFNVFGPYQDPTSQYSGVLAKFTRQMLAGETPTINGDGEHSRDFTYITNVVHGNLLAATAPAKQVAGRVFNVAAGVRITLNEAAQAIRELTGYKGEIKNGPERTGDVRDSFSDCSAAREAFGYEPKVDFRQGLEQTVAWMKTQSAAVAR